jgi:hypothetical protein
MACLSRVFFLIVATANHAAPLLQAVLLDATTVIPTETPPPPTEMLAVNDAMVKVVALNVDRTDAPRAVVVLHHGLCCVRVRIIGSRLL